MRRLREGLLKRWARATWPGGYAVRRRAGVLYVLSVDGLVDRHLAFRGHADTGHIERLAAWMLAGPGGVADLFVDIGAHIGHYTLQMAYRRAARGFIAFEPDPRFRARLQMNLVLNGLQERVRVEPLAVGAERGEAVLRLQAPGDRRCSQITAEGGAIESASTLSVPVVALDDLLNESGARIAAKIDVEDYEPKVLDGMARLLAANTCLLQIESVAHREAVQTRLADLGYRVLATIDREVIATNDPLI